MLASRLPGILPPLSEQEAIEAAAVASVSHGGLDIQCDEVHLGLVRAACQVQAYRVYLRSSAICRIAAMRFW